MLLTSLALGLILLPALILRAIRQRERYCGSAPDPCFWCRRRCTYYNLGPQRTF